jgi:hypothetical protein
MTATVNSCQSSVIRTSHRCAASKLLERFVDVYGEVPLQGSMIEPGMALWRDYWIYSGQHMILTDEGWEPADDVLDLYVADLDDGQPISDVVHDEVNWRFGKKKYPRIFPHKAKKAVTS